MTMNYTKSDLFEKPLIGDLTALEVVPSEYPTLFYTVRDIANIDPKTESFCVKKQILRREIPSSWYRKHLDALDITDADGATPMAKARSAFARDYRVRLAGYSWQAPGDSRLRVVPLLNLLEGLKLYCFEAQKNKDVRVYNEKQAVVKVSSRSPKERQHDIVLLHLPMEEGDDWRATTTDGICCKDAMYMMLSLPRPDEHERKIFCEHEIAAYWSVALHPSVRGEPGVREGNPLPAKYSPFIYPSQELVDFGKRLLWRTFTDMDHKRLLNAAEQEVLLQKYVRTIGPKRAFSGRGKLAQRDWQI